MPSGCYTREKRPMVICEFPGCQNEMNSHGLCMGHLYQRKNGKELTPLKFKRKHGSGPAIICDEAMCNVPGLIGPCHVFRGPKGDLAKNRGYGRVNFKGKTVFVHCYIWECENGAITNGLVIDHQCRNRGCCNVDHLRLVTRQVNNTENCVGMAWQVMAAKTHCPRGHEYTPENTTIGKSGSRFCRACQKERPKRDWASEKRKREATVS